MQIRLCVLRKVEVDDHVHCLDVDASGEQICHKETFSKQAALCTQAHYKHSTLKNTVSLV